MAVYMLITIIEFKRRGQDVPRGSCLGKIVWDGKTEWSPPEGTIAKPDDGREVWTPDEKKDG